MTAQPQDQLPPDDVLDNHALLVDEHWDSLGSSLLGKQVSVFRRQERHSSAPLDDEHGLIVNTVRFANLAKTMVFFHRIFQQSVADFLCRLAIALTHHPFKLLTFFFVASVVDAVGIEQEDVSWTQQRELGHIGGVRLAL